MPLWKEIAMAINTRKDIYNLESNIDTRHLYRTSKLVSNLTESLCSITKQL